MHELAVAVSLVELTCDKARDLGGVRVEAVRVRLGGLSGVAKEALSFCFETAIAGTAIEGARLEIEEVPVTVFCSHCSATRPIPNPRHLRCPTCGRPAFDVIAGRDVELAALEVSDRATHR